MSVKDFYTLPFLEVTFVFTEFRIRSKLEKGHIEILLEISLNLK